MRYGRDILVWMSHINIPYFKALDIYFAENKESSKASAWGCDVIGSLLQDGPKGNVEEGLNHSFAFFIKTYMFSFNRCESDVIIMGISVLST